MFVLTKTGTVHIGQKLTNVKEIRNTWREFAVLAVVITTLQ